jgi:hypothetical protein
VNIYIPSNNSHICDAQFRFNQCNSFREEYIPVFSPYGSDWKSKMATTAGHRLPLDPMGKCSNAFFSETTNMIKAKLYMNVHWMVIIFVVSEKKAFEHFPIGSNVNLCPAVVAILDFQSA